MEVKLSILSENYELTVENARLKSERKAFRDWLVSQLKTARVIHKGCSKPGDKYVTQCLLGRFSSLKMVAKQLRSGGKK